MDLTKVQITGLLRKYAECENSLHNLMEIMKNKLTLQHHSEENRLQTHCLKHYQEKGRVYETLLVKGEKIKRIKKRFPEL